MTIKRRFFISYISAIIITLASVLAVLSLASYITLGTVPSLPQAYRMMNKQRPLTANEEESYLALDQLLKKSPKLLDTPLSKVLKETIQTIEAKGLSVIIRKNARFPYYSDNLVEKSLSVHIPNYEMNNIMPTGTLDNAGRLYHYVKSDFHYLDGSNGSFIVLKRESSLFEFFTRWIIWMILLIILVAIAAAWLINKRLTKTTIEPLEALEKATKTLGKDAQKENPFTPTSHQTVSTEVKQLQLSFEQMWQDLEEANAEREKYEANRKELIANISHDLKTPITSIIGYVEGLMDGVANTEEKKQRYLTVIHEKSLGLNDLIEELFLYSKLDLDRAVFTMEKTNFTRFIAHILEEYRLEQELVITSVLPTEALYVQMDPTQMNRVITNLIQNSIKFADPTKEQLAFTISLTHNQTDLVLTITDNGIGIDKKELPYLFERFYRVDKSRTPTVKGSGLGLSIVKQIIDYHQGTITVTSKKGDGTNVIITLPLLEDEK